LSSLLPLLALRFFTPRAGSRGLFIPPPWSTLAVPLVLAGIVVGSALPARADASVRVELRRKDGSAVDGQVRLSRGAETLSCATQGGACVLAAREGGAYTVAVELTGAPSPKPKTVMIPPSGNVKLVVAVD
jgi:hypothetical protein